MRCLVIEDYADTAILICDALREAGHTAVACFSVQPYTDHCVALRAVQFIARQLMALAGIPFAIAGGVLALYVTGLDFSISAAVGFVSLFGVSVMNGILIITYFNEVRLSGVRGVAAMQRAA